jgi:hypothetical protein
MSAVTIVLGVLFVLFFFFILIGVFIPKVHFTSSIIVNKPVDVAWKVFMDDSKLGDWLPGFKNAELISGRDNEVGSMYKMIFEEKGKVFEMMETLTAVVENKQFSFELDHKVMFSRNDVLFKSKGGNTIIKGVTATKGKGLIMRAMFPLMAGSMKKNNQLAYDNLKKLIEST